MAKMRAQMRECVLRVLQKTGVGDKPLYVMSDRTRNLQADDRSTRGYYLVRNFLQHHDLGYTESVLKGEAALEDETSTAPVKPDIPADAASRLPGQDCLLVEIVDDWLRLTQLVQEGRLTSVETQPLDKASGSPASLPERRNGEKEMTSPQSSPTSSGSPRSRGSGGGRDVAPRPAASPSPTSSDAYEAAGHRGVVPEAVEEEVAAEAADFAGGMLGNDVDPDEADEVLQGRPGVVEEGVQDDVQSQSYDSTTESDVSIGITGARGRGAHVIEDEDYGEVSDTASPAALPADPTSLAPPVVAPLEAEPGSQGGMQHPIPAPSGSRERQQPLAEPGQQQVETSVRQLPEGEYDRDAVFEAGTSVPNPEVSGGEQHADPEEVEGVAAGVAQPSQPAHHAAPAAPVERHGDSDMPDPYRELSYEDDYEDHSDSDEGDVAAADGDDADSDSYASTSSSRAARQAAQARAEAALAEKARLDLEEAEALQAEKDAAAEAAAAEAARLEKQRQDEEAAKAALVKLQQEEGKMVEDVEDSDHFSSYESDEDDAF
eukprot:TRINITY_DN72831_c0_g1_i1.p1 TRINITY_DN72831_c0_g1~~TRINITY_DN72831_c0_g1_i1.p1  ORF type:complete len:591 (+),score=185.39 TRINITY_DN72831_c0_g1_i1:136-1773(+)